MIAWLLSHIKLVGLALGGFLVAGAIFFIRKSGADAERLKQAKADIKVAKTVEKARTESRKMSDAELDKELEKWTRK